MEKYKYMNESMTAAPPAVSPSQMQPAKTITMTPSAVSPSQMQPAKTITMTPSAVSPSQMQPAKTMTPPITMPITMPITAPAAPPMNPPITQSMTSPMTTPMTPPTAKGNMAYRLVYPEIFYRLQPFVLMSCDQMDIGGNFMPTQDMVDQVTDNIYDDVLRVYPDLESYQMKNSDSPANDLPVFMGDFGRGMYRGRDFDRDFYPRRFRRSGSLPDLISILLLSELFRRRRMYYY